MAKNKRRPASKAQAGGARRLGSQNARPAQSSGAQRRAQRAQKHNSHLISWIAIGLVVAVVAVFIVIKVTSNNSPSSSSTGDAAGRSPALASVMNMVDPVATIPLSVFDSVGIFNEGPPYTVTKDQPALKAGSLPRVVYQGAEYCPYCAMVRWAIVSALARFGTFSKLKMTNSADDDGDIATFSFLGSSYTSKYISFTPVEYLDRDQNPLEPVPSDIAKLYAKYDGSLSTGTAASPYNPGTEAGIPFLDFGNRYVSSGAPEFLDTVLNALTGGGPASTTAASAAEIAAALHNPTTSVATAIGAKYLLALANYYSAAVCSIDGGQPMLVCQSSGVKAASTAVAAVTPVD